jgi:hypothetical protein
MLLRRLGRERARTIAGAASLDEAVGRLAGTAYGRTVVASMDLATAQRAIGETALWHVRVLAGWAPPHAIEPIRALAAWFELANIGDRIAYLRGGPRATPFALGGLASVRSPVAGVQSLGELRNALVGSVWGDPGTDDPAGIELALRLSWAARVLDAVEEAEAWAAGAVALLLARELLLAGRPAGELLAHGWPGAGTRWSQASDLDGLRAALPSHAAWVLADIAAPEELWQAEVAWWRRVEADAEQLARSATLGRRALIGSIVLLGADAWRTAAALEVAARGGRGMALEVFEGLG